MSCLMWNLRAQPIHTVPRLLERNTCIFTGSYSYFSVFSEALNMYVSNRAVILHCISDHVLLILLKFLISMQTNEPKWITKLLNATTLGNNFTSFITAEKKKEVKCKINYTYLFLYQRYNVIHSNRIFHIFPL